MPHPNDLTPQEQAQHIWDQLEADEAKGITPQPSEPELPISQQQASEPAANAPAEHHNGGGQADAEQHPASPEMQALLDKISGQEAIFNQQLNVIQQMERRLRQTEGKVGELNAQLKTAREVTDQGGNAPSARQIAAAQQNPEAMARLKDDYPEFANAMEQALNERLAQIEQRIQAAPSGDPKAVTREEFERLQRDNEQRAIDTQIESAHPGWKSKVVDPSFRGWLSRQSIEVRLLAESDSPQAAIRLLDIYGDSTRAPAAQRTQRLTSAAALPSGRQAGYGRQKPVEELTGKELWDYLAAQDKAQA